MIDYALAFGFACASIALLLNLWRLAWGPTLADRILAVDTMVIDTIAIIMLYGIYASSTIHFEGALLFAMVGFVSTVAFCKFILRGNIIE